MSNEAFLGHRFIPNGCDAFMREAIFQNSEKLNIARERFLRYLVDGQRDPTEVDIQQRLDKLGITNWGPLFVVVEISLHIDMYPAIYVDEMQMNVEDAVTSSLRNAGWNVWTYIDSRNCLIAILCADSPKMYSGLDTSVAKLLRKLMEEYGIVIYAGIGSIVSSADEIRYSAKDASTCIAYKYSAAKENVINIKNIKKVLLDASTGNTTAFDRVVGCFLDGDLQRLNVRLTELLDFLSKSNSSIQVVKQAYLELFTLILHRISDAGIKLSEEQTSAYLQYVLKENDAYQLKAWFIDRCSDFICQMGVKRQQSTTHIAEIAKQFVERNYADATLSQQSVSDHLGLSVGYFGQLFFSQTGQRFVDYLHQYRLEIAKKHLLATNDKIKDVSIAVGFSSVNYFNSVFKKYYDMTPKEYRALQKQ